MDATTSILLLCPARTERDKPTKPQAKSTAANWSHLACSWISKAKAPIDRYLEPAIQRQTASGFNAYLDDPFSPKTNCTAR